MWYSLVQEGKNAVKPPCDFDDKLKNANNPFRLWSKASSNLLTLYRTTCLSNLPSVISECGRHERTGRFEEKSCVKFEFKKRRKPVFLRENRCMNSALAVMTTSRTLNVVFVILPVDGQFMKHWWVHDENLSDEQFISWFTKWGQSFLPFRGWDDRRKKVESV